MFDKVTRHFYDDTCVVPEKIESMYLFIYLYLNIIYEIISWLFTRTVIYRLEYCMRLQTSKIWYKNFIHWRLRNCFTFYCIVLCPVSPWWCLAHRHYRIGLCELTSFVIFPPTGEIKQEAGLYREGPTYQRRGSLQLWQFLVALLDDPSNSHFIAWTGRGMEFKLIEPEEVLTSLNVTFFNKRLYLYVVCIRTLII